MCGEKINLERAQSVGGLLMIDRRELGDILHRVIARIKVCADEFQKEEEEKIFCGGDSLM
jgi:hypothetical protein